MKAQGMNAIRRICEDLGLPAGDRYTQDWAYELPEEFRSEAYFDKYIAAYRTLGYGDAEKRLLMQLALDVANDLVTKDAMHGHRAWERLAQLARGECVLHRDQIQYWTLPGEPEEDAFSLTPLARSLWKELYGDVE